MSDIQSVGIVGSGIIGSSWAAVFLRAGLEVSVLCRKRGAADPLRLSIIRQAAALGHDTGDVARRLVVSGELDRVVREADYVQESIAEDRDEKRTIFGDILASAPDHAIVASSTSGIPMSGIAAGLKGRERTIVAHPLTPPHLLPVVEIVPAPFTGDKTVARAMALMRAVGQSPVRLNEEQPGFVLNRLQGALLIELFHAIRDGVIDAADADLLIRDGFGLRWAVTGPLEGIDLNAPGGIADYLERYGPIFDDLARARGQETPVVTDGLVRMLAEARRRELPLDRIKARADWRDRAVAALRKLRPSLDD